MRKVIVMIVLLVTGWRAEARDSIAAVRIANLDEGVQQLSELMNMIQMPFPANQVTAPLGGLVMSPDLTGIDTARPITIYIGDGPKEQGSMPAVVTRFHVTGDGSEYIRSVNGMLPTHEQKSETLHKFPMGGPGGPAFYAVIKDGSALVGYSPEEMRSLVKSVDGDDSKLLEVFPGTVTAWLNTTLLKARIAEQAAEYNKLKKQMEALNLEQEHSGQQVDTGAMMEMVSGVLDQVETFMVNLDLNQQLTLRLFLQAKAESVLSSILDEMSPPSGPVTSMSIPGALFGGFGTMAGMDEVLEPYANWFGSFYASMGPPMDQFAESYKEMVMTMKGVYSGGYNFYMMPPDTSELFQMTGLYEISDREKVEESMSKMMALQAEQMAALTESGDAAAEASEPVTSDYRGMTVTTYAMGGGLGDDAAKDLPPGYGEMLSNMSYHTAFSENYLYYAMGDMKNLDAVIDHMQSGTGSSVVDGFSDVSEDALAYWMMDLPGIISAYASVFEIPVDLDMSGIKGMLRGLSIKEHDGFSSLIRLTAADIQGLVQMSMKLSAAVSQIQAKASNQGRPQIPEGYEIPEEFEMPDEVEPVE